MLNLTFTKDMDIKDLDNREFEERADFIDFNDLISWTVENKFF